jgi:hypothetical protein
LIIRLPPILGWSVPNLKISQRTGKKLATVA